MSICKYEYSICNKHYLAKLLADNCEKRHQKIAIKILDVAKAIRELYKEGGSISLSVGSHYSDLIDCVINEESNKLLIEAGTFINFWNPLYKVDSSGTVKVDQIDLSFQKCQKAVIKVV